MQSFQLQSKTLRGVLKNTAFNIIKVLKDVFTSGLQKRRPLIASSPKVILLKLKILLILYGSESWDVNQMPGENTRGLYFCDCMIYLHSSFSAAGVQRRAPPCECCTNQLFECAYENATVLAAHLVPTHKTFL